jgi:hypothetical protein
MKRSVMIVPSRGLASVRRSRVSRTPARASASGFFRQGISSVTQKRLVSKLHAARHEPRSEGECDDAKRDAEVREAVLRSLRESLRLV